MKVINGNKFYTHQEVSEFCNIAPSTLAHRRETGKVSNGDTLIGRKYYYSEAQLAVVKRELVSAMPRIDGVTIIFATNKEGE